MYSLNFLKRTTILFWVVLCSHGAIAQIIPPVQFAANTCADAKSINVGDCNVLFDIPNTFTESGETVAGAACTAANASKKDGWVSFTTDDAGDYLIRYTNNSGSEDAALALYSGTCGVLSQVGTCENTTPGLDELVATGLAAGTTYYIRVMNVFNNASMQGFLCVVKDYTSDNAVTALAARRLPVNSCNIRFDVKGTESGFGDPGGSCGTINPTGNGKRDSWITFDATAGDVISIEYQADNNSVRPAIVLYRDNIGTPDIDLDPITGGNQQACYDGNNTGSSFAKVDYTITAAGINTYYVRVINMGGTGVMEGQLCLYNSTKRAYNDCTVGALTGAGKLSIGDCNIQFNVFGGATNDATQGPSQNCASGAHSRDVWGAFDATLDQIVTIKYNNDNNDPSASLNTAIEVYRDNGNCPVLAADRISCVNTVVEGLETLTFKAPAGDTYFVRIVNGNGVADASAVFGKLCIVNGSVVEEDLCITSKDFGVGDCDVDFNVVNTRFLDNEGRTAASCAGAPANYKDGWLNFVALSSRTSIRYQYNASQDAVLTVYTGDCSSLTELGCVDGVTGTVTGGIESVEITTVPGQSYFVRVTNKTATGDLIGKMCITNVVNRNDCDDTQIQEIPIGSCSVPFDLPVAYTPFTATSGDASCGGTVAVQKDAWARFTGNGGDITITYESTDANSNPFIEIFRGPLGTCATRVFEVCSGQNCNYNGNQIEQVTMPGTINGATYYVRVVNTSAAGGGVMTGNICIYNSSTIPPPGALTNKISTNTCAAANTLAVGDCGIRINIPTSSAACASNITNFKDSGATLGGCVPGIGFGVPTSDAWSTFTANSTETYTIEYSNENQDLSLSNDVAVAVYSGTCGALVFEACVNDIAAGSEGVEKLTFAATNGTQYFVRIMNISGNSTGTYGRLCVFSGTSAASNTCSAAKNFPISTNDAQFNIETSFGLDNADNSATITSCVLAGAARKDAWARFTTAASLDSTITVVYDNDDGDAITSLDPDVVNVGVAIYQLTGSIGACGSLTLVACANSVGEGKETVTFNTRKDGSGNIIPTTYYIRIISTNSNDAVQGKLSIFPFLQCTLGSERVRDGNFTNFDKTFAGSTTDVTLLATKQRRQSFATEYGYRPDVNGAATNSELHPEGYYSVSHSANNVHGAFYAYGYPHAGWGPNGSYCTTGGGVGSDACPYVSPTTILTTRGNDANLLIVNGRRNRGKFWCQTIYPLTPGGFYVFTAWFNSLIPTDRSSLDDPQLRITVCEGTNANPLYDGSLASKGVTLNVTGANAYEAAYPGSIGTITAEEATHDVVHRPIHPGVNTATLFDGIFYSELAPSTGYGAARPCNTNNIDLKILNSDVFLPESPDRWVPMRCIYKAPAVADGDLTNVNQINLCVENISATTVGNDFGIDFITFQECTNSTDPLVRSALQSTNCELTGNPDILGIPLNVRLVELKGILRGNKIFLDWLTLTEQGALRFDVQRGLPGGKFRTIGRINAKGFSETPTPYNFVDTDLPEGHKFVFYRLRVVNVDNTEGYSPIIKINIESINDMQLKLIPNPTTTANETLLQFATPRRGEATVSITSIMGVQIHKFKVKTLAGLNRVVLPVSNLQAGIYVIRVTQGGILASKKLVVNK